MLHAMRALTDGDPLCQERVVSRREAEDWARSKGMLFVESSAKTKIGIQQVFNEVVQKVRACVCFALSVAVLDADRRGVASPDLGEPGAAFQHGAPHPRPKTRRQGGEDWEQRLLLMCAAPGSCGGRPRQRLGFSRRSVLSSTSVTRLG